MTLEESLKMPLHLEGLLKMPLHSNVEFNDHYWIRRVPGGWIYHYCEACVFVPEPKKEDK